MKTSATRRLGYEVLSREFHNSLVEVGCKSQELRNIVLQAGIIENDPQSELQTSYRQLMKDATELLRVVADKMYRLKTKIDLSTAATVRSEEPHQGAASGTRTARPHRQSAVTYQARSWELRAGDETSSHSSNNYQARSWHLRAGDKTSSHSSNNYRMISARPPLSRRPEDSNHFSSASSASTWQGRNLQSLVPKDAALQERQSDPCAPARGQCVHSQLSSGSARVDAPLAENDDLAVLLGMESTFSDLPGLDKETSAHSEGSSQQE